MKKIVVVLIIIKLQFCSEVTAQVRITDKNNIGWYTTTGTIKFAQKWSIHLEYQWRRDNYITNWQQSLLRTGINYQLHENVIVRLGYAWIETFPYGDYPINKFGKQFTEHRTYQVITTNQKIGRFDLSNRYMIEQRWLATYNNAGSTDPDKWTYLNRIRYMGRIQTALKGKTITDKTPYAAVYDEIMIGFGQNVGQNIFDQNRLGLLLGYRFNKQFRIEGGYFNQVLQLGYRESFTGKNIYQFNRGFIINTFWNL